ncbi:hypothetical protein GT93_25805 [Pseudomonas plecoglossicida]|nr:hypothetical protein GT93_25805 [Pseudomonas plecoglossicida]
MWAALIAASHFVRVYAAEVFSNNDLSAYRILQMRNLDLDSLQIFKAVVDYGGITNAAAQLNRVQSNITTRVKNLEERLGVALFHRNGGRVVV